MPYIETKLSIKLDENQKDELQTKLTDVVSKNFSKPAPPVRLEIFLPHFPVFRQNFNQIAVGVLQPVNSVLRVALEDAAHFFMSLERRLEIVRDKSQMNVAFAGIVRLGAISHPLKFQNVFTAVNIAKVNENETRRLQPRDFG